jgi:hypothetical protein
MELKCPNCSAHLEIEVKSKKMPKKTAGEYTVSELEEMISDIRLRGAGPRTLEFVGGLQNYLDDRGFLTPDQASSLISTYEGIFSFKNCAPS